MLTCTQSTAASAAKEQPPGRGHGGVMPQGSTNDSLPGGQAVVEEGQAALFGPNSHAAGMPVGTSSVSYDGNGPATNHGLVPSIDATGNPIVNAYGSRL